MLDFYRTDFQNQVVVDLDYNPQQALFYNLSGQSYSNSFQAEINYELIKRLECALRIVCSMSIHLIIVNYVNVPISHETELFLISLTRPKVNGNLTIQSTGTGQNATQYKLKSC
jgi:hypothetical protein